MSQEDKSISDPRRGFVGKTTIAAAVDPAGQEPWVIKAAQAPPPKPSAPNAKEGDWSRPAVRS